jgi:hypothetical protein
MVHRILDIHQQNAQITNKVQLAPYHCQTLHICFETNKCFMITNSANLYECH